MFSVRQGLKSFQRSIQRTATSWNQMANQMIWNGGAIAASATMTANSFISAADQAEKLRLRLQGMLGSVDEGNKLFETMAVHAGSVPQTYQEIMESATTLSGVLKGGREEVQKYMPLLTDLAAAYDLPMKVVTGNFVRMYSAGAQAADLFRERGITSMMGFKAGATYTTEETMRMMWESWQKSGSKFHGAAARLGKTWSGLMSMFQDKWFNFRRFVIEETGVFDWLKRSLAGLNKYFQDNWLVMMDWVKLNRVMVRSIFQSIILLGGLGVALVAVGVAFKTLAFTITLTAWAFNPIFLAIGLLIASTYTLRAVWNKLWTEAGPAMESVVNNIVRGFHRMVDDFMKGSQEFGIHWGKVWDFILWFAKGAANLVIGVVMAMIRGVSALFGYLWEVVSHHVGSLLDAFSYFFKSLQAMLDRDFTMAAWWKLQAEASLKEGLNIKKALKGVGQAFKEAGKEVKDNFTRDWIGEFAGEMKKTLPVLGELAKTMWGEFKFGAAFAMDAVKEQFGKDMDALIAIAREKAPFIAGAFDALKQGFVAPEVDTTIADQMNAMLEALNAEFEAFVQGLKDTFAGIGQGFEQSFSSAFSEVLQGQATFSEASKAFASDLMRYMADETARMVAKRLRIIIFGEDAAATAKRAGAIKQFAFDKAMAVKEMSLVQWVSELKIATWLKTAFQRLVIAKWVALKEFAIEKWKTMKSVALQIWEATAKFIKAHANIPYVGLALGVGFAAAAVAAIAAAKGSFLTGTDYVPETGNYTLHRGEQVLSRPEVDQRRGGGGGGGDISLVNVFTSEGFAAGMGTQEGRDVIINTITEDIMRNGQTRRVLRETGSV